MVFKHEGPPGGMESGRGEVRGRSLRDHSKSRVWGRLGMRREGCLEVQAGREGGRSASPLQVPKDKE